ncbi:MAG: hypothetical protein EZS28_047505 [Streblomastix strix]|uniref:Uncharacterized protein n=1 Tax=Streblomastix strix TaxID=222440 RepID=A0A5J4TFH0_9EUKA|nr:MAG: hypothetical protein EZS28_047505 [Streblomastix strix]
MRNGKNCGCAMNRQGWRHTTRHMCIVILYIIVATFVMIERSVHCYMEMCRQMKAVADQEGGTVDTCECRWINVINK